MNGKIYITAYNTLKWSLKKIIEKLDYDDAVNVNYLKTILQQAWDDLVQEGEIELK